MRNPVRIPALFLLALSGFLPLQPVRAQDVQHWTTPNGARVYFIERHELPMVDVSVQFAAGERYSPAAKTGLATLANSLLDSGNETQGEADVATRLADLGARLTAGCDVDRAGLTLRTLSSPRERDGALALLRTLLARPDYPAAVLAREKTRSGADLEEADTRPDALAEKAFFAAAYGSHPYGRSATPRTLDAIQRQDLLDFHRRHYTARRAVVALVGDLSRTQAETVARDLTADLPAGESVEEESPPPAAPAATTLRLPHPASQSHILLGLPALKRDDPDYFPLLVGNYVLGGGAFASRLMKEVREKRGYAYDVESHFEPRRDAGPFVISLQTRRDQADAALAVVRRVLADFLRDGPTAAELAAARRNLAGGFPLRLDSNAKQLEYLETMGFHGLPLDYLARYQERVRAVTTDQVRAAFARRVKAEHLVTVIVGTEPAVRAER